MTLLIPNPGDPLVDGDIVVRRVSDDEWQAFQVGPKWTAHGLVGSGIGGNAQEKAWRDLFYKHGLRRNAKLAQEERDRAAAEAASPPDLRVEVARNVAEQARRGSRRLLILLTLVVFVVVAVSVFHLHILGT